MSRFLPPAETPLTTATNIAPVAIHPAEEPRTTAVEPGTPAGAGVVTPVEAGVNDIIGAVARNSGWQSIPQRWSARPVPLDRLPQVRWWLESGRLIQETLLPHPVAPRFSFSPPEFHEGLWKQDVVEVFISDRRTGSYVEYNLGPGGAWWAAVFQCPRNLLMPQPAPESFRLVSEVQWTDTHWIGRMSLPLPDPEHSCINFTAITHDPQGPAFFSHAPLSGEKPDFHQPSLWIPFHRLQSDAAMQAREMPG